MPAPAPRALPALTLVPGPFDPRTRSDQIRAQMLATQPRGPLASGLDFEALASTLYYLAILREQHRSGKMDRGIYATHQLRACMEWACWRIRTGEAIALDTLLDGVIDLVTQVCGPCPGMAA